MKIKATLALFRCGRCGRNYANPLGHVCTVRMDRKTPVRKTRLATKVSVTRACPKCRKPAGNPLTHVCVVRSDWRKRKAAAEKQARAARRASAPRHLYQACNDRDCVRLPCIAWKEGRAEGYQEGYEVGHEVGYASGYSVGYAAGYAAGAASAGGD